LAPLACAVQGDERGADGLRQVAERGGDDLHALALLGPEVGHRGLADAAEVAFAEFGRCRLRFNQTAADDDVLGVQRDEQVGNVQAKGTCLEVEDLERERIALLRAAAQRQRLLLRRYGGGGELVRRVTLEEIL